MRQIISDFIKVFKRIPEEILEEDFNDGKSLSCNPRIGVVHKIAKEEYKVPLEQAINSSLPDSTRFNNTFHKTFRKVESTSQELLWIDAMIHYFTTYGLEELGIDSNNYIYIPEEECEVPELRKFYFLDSISNDEAIEKIEDILSRDMALSENLIDSCVRILEYLNCQIDFNKIKNKDVRILYFAKSKTVPDNGEDCVKVINYIITGRKTFIKGNVQKVLWDKHSYFGGIQDSKYIPYVNQILLTRQEEIAEVFFRYKDFIVLLKKSDDSFKPLINRIRRLAEKRWKPYNKKEFISTQIIHGEVSLTDFDFDKYTIYELVKIYNKLNYLLTAENPYGIYRIRDGRVYVKKIQKTFVGFLGLWCKSIKNNISKRVKSEDYIILKNDDVNISFPESEKSFIGDVPLYTSIYAGYASVVGVSWKNKKNQRVDIDLSAVTKTSKYGWNSNYYSNDRAFIYSGDMTSEGAESFYIESKEDALFYVNLFNVDDADFDFFMAKTEKEVWKKEENKFTTDPNNLIYSAKLHTDKKQQAFGILANGDFSLINFSDGSSNISSCSNVSSMLIESLADQAKASLKLSDIFEDYNASKLLNEDLTEEEIIGDKTLVDLRELSISSILDLCKEK